MTEESQLNEFCPRCDDPVAAPPYPNSHYVFLHGSTGNIAIADGEYPLHRCSGLDPAEEQDLLRQAAELFDHDIGLGPEAS